MYQMQYIVYRCDELYGAFQLKSKFSAAANSIDEPSIDTDVRLEPEEQQKKRHSEINHQQSILILIANKTSEVLDIGTNAYVRQHTATWSRTKQNSN